MDINGKMAGKNVVSEALAASRKYETQNEIDKNERPLFHVTPPVGWMNDPNGFSYYQGEYHLFYQYNPYHDNWDSMHWGHAVSRDLIHWEELEPALVPDMPYDNDKNGGCFSGSVVVHDDQLFLFYTGRTEDETGIFETQNLAVSKDGIHFVKAEENPLIKEVPEKGGRDFRDPKVFFAQGKWRMICGGSTGRIEHPDSCGRIYLFSSTDLYHWAYSGILYEAEPGEGRMFECPDAFCLDDVWFLTTSPMYEKDSVTTLYLSGQVDFDKCEFHKEIRGTLDLGTHYYAAQTYPVLHGEIRSVAWLGGWLWMPWIRDFGPEEGYRGILDVSRVWYLDDNRRLCAKVADKVKSELKVFSRTLEKHWTGENIPPQSEPVMVELKGKLPGDGELLCIDLYDTDRHIVTICFDSSNKEMTVNYNRADRASRYGIRTVPCEMMEKETDIDILIDGNTFTLLWEHGLYRYTGKLYPQGNIGVDIKYRTKRHYDITSLGEILIDFTGKKESERQTLSYTQNPGGAPANVVVAAQRLGAQTAFIGKIGEDFLGDFLKETLDKCGVSTEGLISDADYFTTLAFVKLADNGERNFAFARKPGADIGLKAEEIRKDIICQSRILHVGSLSLTDELSRNAEFIALKAAKNNGTIISYDPNYRASLWDSQEEACKWMRSILEYADIVKVSEEEIELLTGYTDVRKAAESITEYGAKIVLITLGEKGSFVYLQDQQEAYVSGYSSKVVDTTGAGDSFMGGFLYKICESGKRIEEYSLQEMIECVRFGNAVASLCVEREGAIPAMPVMEEVIKRINS